MPSVMPITTTFALLAEEGQTQGGPSMLFPFVLILGVFYFLLIRPESKRRKEHDEMLRNLGKGDTVLTTGGIVGTIVTAKENVMSLQIADGVRIKVVRNAIQGLVDPNTGQSPAAAGADAKASAGDKQEKQEG